jgi:alpha-glucosidase
VAWWQEGVFYHIYPHSFADSNGDGIGDLRGIIERLDYLAGAPDALGIDAIWLTPTFPSPMKDFGYDVSDYLGVHPNFGDLATMDALIAACHDRGVRVLLDYVPNHSSDQHPWFRASRASRENPFRDWYTWRDPRPDGSPPNNWLGAFGGIAWEWDERTGQFYLHSFLREQPDLNWRNPAVRAAMLDVMRYWFRRGVDGFRIDVLGMVLKDPLLRDNPPNPDYDPATSRRARNRQLLVYNRNYAPDCYEAARWMRAVADEFPERMLVGEVFGPPEVLAGYYGGERLDGIHLAFNFNLLGGYDTPFTPWSALTWRAIVDASERGLPAGAQPAWALGNHDQSRLMSRLGNDGLEEHRARVAAAILLTLRGTPFIYYGEEIGMRDVPIPPDKEQDPARFGSVGRDPERTPMQWDDTPNAGFTTGTPWLPVGDTRMNVAAQRRDPDSLLALYRRLIALRHATPALRRGSYRSLDGCPPDVFAYVREEGTSRAFIAANFAAEPRSLSAPAEFVDRPLLRTSRPSREERAAARIDLDACEACVIVAESA